MKQTYILQPAPHPSRSRAIDAIKTAPDGSKVTIGPDVRTKEQNARYWSRGVLAQIAEQANILRTRFSPEAWHELFKRMFIGVEELPDGSIKGKSSTELSKKEFSEFSDQVEAYAVTELGVVFTDLAPRETG